ncbi:MFS transporter, partial [Actinophytocola sp.]|uniref:MFS transporter n=1 Tax=Actinophytocola sp. TaxID=1872138 RepID=UPI00389B3034
MLVVLHQWERPPDHRPLGSEHVLSATRAGLRYIRHAPRFAKVLARSALFMVFASGLWALLPAVARDQLHLSAGGYGLLLASVGLGAVVGTSVVPRLRDRFGTGTVVNAAMFGYGLTMVVVGVSGSTLVVMGVLVVAGVCWIGVQSTLMATAQLLLPAWTRARALAYMQFVFMGGQALGALGWGAVAEGSLATAFLVPAAGLVAGTAVSVRPLRLPEGRLDVTAVRHWPEPGNAMSVDSGAGPVLVTVEWPVDPAHADAFVGLMHGRVR